VDVIIDIARADQLSFSFKRKSLASHLRTKKGQLYVEGDLYAVQQFEPARDRFLDWVASAPNTQVLPGRTLKESFVYDDNFSLWWMTKISQKQFNKTPIATYFHQIAALERIFAEYRDQLFADQRSLTFVLCADSAEEFKYFSHKIRHLVNRVADQALPHVSFESGFEPETVTCSLKGIFRAIARATRAIRATWRASRQLREQDASSQNDAEILIATDFPRDWLIKSGDGSKSGTDRYLGEIYHYLKANNESVAWLPALASQGQVAKWQSLGLFLDAVHLRFSFLQALSAWWRITRHLILWHLTFVLIWRRVSKQADCSSGEKSAESLLTLVMLADIKRSIDGTSIPHLVRYELLKRSFPTTAKCVLLRKEFHSTGRLLKAALKERKTQVVGVQHGMAREVYYLYFPSPQETGLTRDTTGLHTDYIHYMPVPDYDLLFGEYTKNMLLQYGGYPEQRLIVTGATRQDAMVNRWSKLSTSDLTELERTLKLPVDRGLLLLCTGDAKFVGSVVSLVIEAIQATESRPHLLVKLHPFHGGKEEVIDVAHSKGFADYTVVDEDIGDLLLASDVVCSQVSTVAYEAVLLGRPHMLIAKGLNFRRGPLFSEFCIFPVDEAAEAAEVLDRLFLDRDIRKKFEKEREGFLHRYLHNTDGKALERVRLFLRGLN
jgi:surface carbohydrate biosynthesis protein (TIGR04326 family)